ncbi:MAG: glycosyltransferase [Planctomycetota bacterium]|jgi:cellulose synthase/poly-beta-1,6-N-acetylglucosamine synthase-like glycosyltransferase
MITVTTILVATICVSLAIQSLLVFGFTRLMKRPRMQLLADSQCPEAAVVLCLRGGDPFLNRCVEALLQQDYPCYRMIFIVDHERDPAMEILRSALENASMSNYELQLLSDPPGSCSLKCSSLIQAYRSLPDSTVILAQLDADTIPHPSWLRELATGLESDGVGAVTGNRWYAPEISSQGALVRHVWNAAAIVQMSWYRIAWGGTLAIKVSTIQQAKLDERWSQALCEDTMLSRQLARIGQRVEFAPNLIMVNREDCSLASFIPWVTRQLLTARLYHRAWPLVVVHGIASAAILVSGWFWVATLVFRGRYEHAGLLAIAMSVFQVALVLLVLWIGRAVESALARAGRRELWGQPSFARWLWIVTLTQWVYSWALLRCLVSRSTHWRGIHYRIGGPWGIKMEGYQPYAESVRAAPSVSQGSL